MSTKATKKRVYTVRIEDENLIERITSESERRQISRPSLVSEALELHLKSDSGTQSLIDECDKLKRQLEAAREISSKLQERNKEIAEERDAANAQRDKFKDKYLQAVLTNEKIVDAVRNAKAGGLFSRAAKLKQMNLALFSIPVDKGESM